MWEHFSFDLLRGYVQGVTQYFSLLTWKVTIKSEDENSYIKLTRLYLKTMQFSVAYWQRYVKKEKPVAS